MPDLPTGTLTFLFSDIEGSTTLSRTLGDKFSDVLYRHRRLVSDAVEREGGLVYGFFGDAASAVCLDTTTAVAAAAATQHAFAESTWPDGSDVRVRIGIHSGEATAETGDYVGLDVHHTARVCAAAHGGQVLLSEAAHSGLEALPPGVAVRDLGVHQLKDFPEPERLFQLLMARLRNEFPPLRIGDGGMIGRASSQNRELRQSLQDALKTLSRRQSTLESDVIDPNERRLGTSAREFSTREYPMIARLHRRRRS